MNNNPGLLANIGNKLRTIRRARDEKIETVANTLHINKATLSKIENGLCTSLSVVTLHKLCDYYKTPFIQMPD